MFIVIFLVFISSYCHFWHAALVAWYTKDWWWRFQANRFMDSGAMADFLLYIIYGETMLSSFGKCPCTAISSLFWLNQPGKVHEWVPGVRVSSSRAATADHGTDPALKQHTNRGHTIGQQEVTSVIVRHNVAQETQPNPSHTDRGKRHT